MVWPGDDHGYGSGGQNPHHQNTWPPPQGQDGGQDPRATGAGQGGGQPGWYPPSGYGGPGGYGGPWNVGAPGNFGGMPGPPPPSRGVSGGVIAAIVGVAILLVGGGIGTAVAASGGHKKPRHATAAPSSLAPSPPRLAPTPSSPPPAQAKVPGWRAVVAIKHGVTYDVPPGTWTVQSPDMIVGFEDPSGKPEVAGSGAAVYKQGYCKGHSGSWRAQTAVSGYSTADLAGDAQDAARKWATYGYTPDDGGSAPTVTLGATQAISAGGVSAQEATATVAVHDGANACSPPRGVVHAVAVPLKSGGVSVLVVIADQGVADAMPDADLQKIAASARPTA
jgi:hypothetical protein